MSFASIISKEYGDQLATQNKKEKSRKALEGLSKVNSPLDLLDKISQIKPTKKQVTLDVTKFLIDEDILSVEGTINSNESPLWIQNILQEVSTGRVEKYTSSAKPGKGKKTFALSTLRQFPTNRQSQ